MLGRMSCSGRVSCSTDVSYHLVVHMEGTSQSFGTPNAIKVYEENEEDFLTALADDAIDLCGAALERDEAVNERKPFN